MTLEKHKQNWDDLGAMDPCWAILSDSDNKNGNWDIEQFFATGKREIDAVLEFTGSLGYPREWKSALDFGCGVGRLTRALAGRFERCTGVDISDSMIAGARKLNQEVANCEFVLNDKSDLQVFPEGHFDLIYTNLVLQHVPQSHVIKSYIKDFVRVLKKNGILVFQVPSYIPLRKRLQPKRRLYSLLRMLGFNKDFLYNRLKLHPIMINCVPEREVVSLLKASGANVLHIRHDRNAGALIESRTYYVTK